MAAAGGPLKTGRPGAAAYHWLYPTSRHAPYGRFYGHFGQRVVPAWWLNGGKVVVNGRLFC